MRRILTFTVAWKSDMNLIKQGKMYHTLKVVSYTGCYAIQSNISFKARVKMTMDYKSRLNLKIETKSSSTPLPCFRLTVNPNHTRTLTINPFTTGDDFALILYRSSKKSPSSTLGRVFPTTDTWHRVQSLKLLWDRFSLHSSPIVTKQALHDLPFSRQWGLPRPQGADVFFVFLFL